MRGWRAGVGFGFVVLAGLPACGNNAHPGGALPGAVAGVARIVVASTSTAPAATSTTALLPATTVPPPPPTPGSLYAPGTWELSDADFDEPFCPERSDQGPGASGADPEAAITEQTRLEPMLGIVLAYGTEHADSFGSYGLHWNGADDASVFISFTHDVAAHRAALMGMVPFPEELIVCRAAITGDDVRVLHQQLVDYLEGRFVHVGMGNGHVTVGLYAQDEALAAELVATYGDAVKVTVGLFPYPMPDPVPPPQCEPVPPPPPGLELAAASGEASSITLQAAATSDTFDLTLTNTTDATIEFMHGVWIARLARRGDTVSTAHFVGGIPAIGYTLSLEPGASEEIAVSVPTAACDATVGYQIPPGDYDVYIIVDHPGDVVNVPDEDFALGPVPIALTAP